MRISGFEGTTRSLRPARETEPVSVRRAGQLIVCNTCSTSVVSFRPKMSFGS